MLRMQDGSGNGERILRSASTPRIGPGTEWPPVQVPGVSRSLHDSDIVRFTSDPQHKNGEGNVQGPATHEDAIREQGARAHATRLGDESRKISDTDKPLVGGTTKFDVRVGDTYAAGPMRGILGFNYKAFRNVVFHLRNESSFWGEVVSPHENFPPEKHIPYETCMQVDLIQVVHAKRIVLLPGWEKSEGAKTELTVALSTHTEVWLAHMQGEQVLYFEQVDEPWSLVHGIEEEARRLVYGERNKDYGPPTKDFNRTGKLWASILGLDKDIPPEKVALMMAGLKISRLCESPDHYDSRVDVIGYMLTFDRVMRGV